jgi:KipI family sensor histidine kinase inhibitor
VSRGLTARVREIGDSSLVLELGSTLPGQAQIDITVSRRATAVARVVKQRAISGVRDVVPTFRSVVVSFDPLSTDVSAVAAALHEDVDAAPDGVGRVHEVPVVYGDSDGPDLEAVAAYAGCSPDVVVQRHASRTYRVFMLGFLPGFAYMGSVDETIAVPRKPTPRLRVPAGSVGIAGQQTGIYPLDAPGGWHIIGRAGVTPFESERVPPSLFAPGDEVRFVPASTVAVPRVDPVSAPSHEDSSTGMGGYVTVLRPGLLTTVQDAGRWGHQEVGVSVSGPMDPMAHRLANVVVGNRPDAATLEATFLGPELRMEQHTRLALAGADLRATVDGFEVSLHTTIDCRAGSVLRFGERRSGARVYVAFDGGVAVTPLLGSRATHLRSGVGGFHGRPLMRGDRIVIGQPSPFAPFLRASAPDLYPGGARLRVLPGPQVEHFLPSALDALQHARYTISADSDRMGYRLTGGARLASDVGGTMVSDAAFLGGLQIPPSGDPILLMADRPTTGGYPQIAVVISADIPLAGQLGAGDWVEFEVCSRADAIAALVAQEGRILAVR